MPTPVRGTSERARAITDQPISPAADGVTWSSDGGYLVFVTERTADTAPNQSAANELPEGQLVVLVVGHRPVVVSEHGPRGGP